jgi:hypothetical protein
MDDKLRTFLVKPLSFRLGKLMLAPDQRGNKAQTNTYDGKPHSEKVLIKTATMAIYCKTKTKVRRKNLNKEMSDRRNTLLPRAVWIIGG